MPEQQMGEHLMGFFPHDYENGGVGGAIVKEMFMYQVIQEQWPILMVVVI